MRVLAIDPGERVGWARADILGGNLELHGHGISGLKDFALALAVAAGTYDAIVYETFRLSAAKAKSFAGNDFPVVQLIGMIRLCAWRAGVPLIAQGPAIKTTALKTMRANERRDLLDIVEPALAGVHDDGHHGDAILHLWHYYWERYV